MLMARLFIQNGTERPQCILRRSFSTLRDPLSENARRAQWGADRWWWVECRSAAAGRETIENALSGPVGGCFQASGPGVILSSGRKR